MADKSSKYAQNAEGKFYVDNQCIACDACCTTAPDFFKMDDNEGHAYLSAQPQTPEQESQCKEAMEGCPVEAIGNDGP
jgi:ferredoxin